MSGKTGSPRILEGTNPVGKKFFCFEKEIYTLFSSVHNVNFTVFILSFFTNNFYVTPYLCAIGPPIVGNKTSI